MDYQSVEYSICKLLSNLTAELDELANKYRAEVIIPFCKKHQATFDGTKSSYYKFDYILTTRVPIKGESLEEEEILDTINLDVYGSTFGFHILPVYKKDLET
jgi:hypothetical protein